MEISNTTFKINNNKSIVPVVFSTDHNFIMPTSVAIRSMLEVSRDVKCDIYILQSADVTDEDCTQLKALAEKYDAGMTFLLMTNEFDGLYEIRNITKAAYYRLMIPWLLPDLEKVIYVDGDIIFKKSISTLWNYEYEESKLLYGVHTFKYDIYFKDYAKKINLNYREYINSGVLVFNSNLHRELNIKKLYETEMKKEYMFQDQDVINIVCKGKIGFLPEKFNVSPDAINLGGTYYDDAVIIHYAGAKPWNTFVKGWIDWWLNYENSPFYDRTLGRRIEDNSLNIEYSYVKILKMFIKKILKL